MGGASAQCLSPINPPVPAHSGPLYPLTTANSSSLLHVPGITIFSHFLSADIYHICLIGRSWVFHYPLVVSSYSDHTLINSDFIKLLLVTQLEHSISLLLLSLPGDKNVFLFEKLFSQNQLSSSHYSKLTELHSM